MLGLTSIPSTDETVKYIPKFGGNIFYVDKNNGSDNNDGTKPEQAFETIGAGINAMSSGDALNVRAGTFVNEPFNGFAAGTNAIVAEIADTYEIDWHASFSSQDANRTVHFGVAINGETLTNGSKGVVGTFAKNAGQTYSVSGTTVVELNAGDTVQLQVTSSTDADEVTIKHFTTTIAKFYRGL